MHNRFLKLFNYKERSDICNRKISKDQMPNDQNSWNDQKSVRWTVGAATYFFKNNIEVTSFWQNLKNNSFFVHKSWNRIFTTF